MKEMDPCIFAESPVRTISVSSSFLFSFSGVSQPITSGVSMLTSSVCDYVP